MVVLAWLGAVFAGVVSALSVYFVKRLAVLGAVIALLVSLTVGLTVSLNAAIAALTVAMPGGLFSAGFALMPSNAAFAFSTIMSAHAVKYVYVWKARFIQMRLL